MSPKTYNEVRDEYLNFKSQYPSDPTQLADFARAWDEEQGTPGLRQSAYNDNWLKQLDASVDRGFRATKLPQVAGWTGQKVGSWADALLGTNVAPTVERIAEETPRMLVESALTIPAAASGVGTAGAVANVANRVRKLVGIAKPALGYGGAALQGYSQTDSPLGAVIGPAQMWGMNKLLLPAARAGVNVPLKAEEAVQKWLKVPQEVAQETATNVAAQGPSATLLTASQRYVPRAARLAAEAGVMTGGNEATRQAMLSVGPNAVGLADEARNPFTEENIAANIAGTVPFVGQAVLGLRDVPRFSAREHVSMAEWYETRRHVDELYLGGTEDQRRLYDSLTDPQARQEWIEKVEAEQVPGDQLGARTPLAETPIADLSSRQRVVALQSAIDATVQADVDGAVEVAQRGRQYISGLLDSLALSDIPLTPEETAKAAQVLVDTVRESPPLTPAGLDSFVRDVNSTIEAWNKVREKYETLTEMSFEDRTTLDEKTIVALEGQKGKTWRQEARDPVVVKQLQAKKLVPTITEDWLKQEFDWSFEHSGNAQFSYEVMLQKAANRLVDAIPEGLRKAEVLPVETEKPSVDTGTAMGRLGQLDEKESLFIQSLVHLPKEVQNAAIEHTVMLKRDDNIHMFGSSASRYPAWREAIVEAYQTYDPQTHTAIIDGKRQNIGLLIERDKNGQFVYEPKLRQYSAAEAGRNEPSIEGMQRQIASPDIPSDFEDIKRVLAEEGAGPVVGRAEMPEGGEIINPAEKVAVETVGPETGKQDFYAKTKELQEALNSLTDAQLHEATRGAFRSYRTDPLETYRQTGGTRAALEAVLETYMAEKGTKGTTVGPKVQAFLDKDIARNPLTENEKTWTPRRLALQRLNRFFMQKTPVMDGRVGLSNAEARVAQIIERVLNPKIREIVTQRGLGGPSLKIEDPLAVIVKKQLADWEEGVFGSPDEGFANNTDLVSFAKDKVGADALRKGAKNLIELTGLTESRALQAFAAFVADYKNPLVQKILSWKGPQAATAQGAKTEPVYTSHIYTNRSSDTFVRDTTQSFKKVIYDSLGAAGFDGTWRDLWAEKAYLLATQLGDVPADFFQLKNKESGGLAFYSDVNGELRANVGVRFGEKPAATQVESVRYVNKLMNLLAHEISHVDDFVRLGLIDAPDAYSRERKQQLANLDALANVLTPEQRNAQLRTLYNALEPQIFSSLSPEPTNPALAYGSLRANEFTAQVTSIVTRALVQGRPSYLSNALNVFDFSPIEIRNFATSTWRTIGDVLEGMKKSILDPSMREQAGLPSILSPGMDKFATSDVLEAVIMSARAGSKLRFADKQYAAHGLFVQSMAPGAGAYPPVMTNAFWDAQTAKITKEGNFGKYAPEARQMPATVQTIQQAAAALQGIQKPNYDKSLRTGIWSNWFKPFVHVMWEMDRAGIPLAREFVSLAFDYQTTAHRGRTSILNPIMQQGPTGAWKYNESHPLLEKIKQDRNGPWRKAVNEVSMWQQELRDVTDPITGKKAKQEVAMFKRDPQTGTISVDPLAQKDWDRIRQRLSPEDQQYVMASSIALDEITQNAGGHVLASLHSSMINLTADRILSMNPQMTYETASELAAMTVVACVPRAGQPFNPVPSLQRTGLPQAQIDTLTKYLIGGKMVNGVYDGLVPNYLQVAESYANKPGHRSESLPWDWLVRYRPAGFKKVMFASAKTEHAARVLAAKLRSQGATLEGEIVNKRELSEFVGFENPEEVLRKAGEIEQKAFDRLVTQVEASHGTQMADMLRAGYTPLAEAAKNLKNQGFRRFLSERKGLIGREEYDYIDGTIAYVDALTASVARKEITQRKNLILHDPRARGVPSFVNLVDEHFTEMMTPTSDWARKAKMFSTGYFLAGSFGSALVEMTQSLVSTIPVLMAENPKGGLVRAYGQLGRSIGEAMQVTLAKDWQQQAKIALQKDPKQWTKQEAIYASYFKHVEDGGVTHGVVEDLFFGRDQRTLEAAKFGTGDYNDMTVGKMLANPLYMGTQFLMLFYKWAAKFNNKISFLSSVDQGYDKGLRGQELYDYARMNKALMTYEGGKANQIGAITKLSNDYTRSPFGVANTLQQYGYGMVGTFHQLMKDSLGRSAGLTPQQRLQAIKSLGVWAATNTALAGVLGMPFAAAALTMLDKMGVPASESVREGLASLWDDDETGAVFAETALNGIANQMLGIDASSRLGVSNLLGTSSYRGFNVADMFGPAVSIATNVVDGLNLFGRNEPVKAARTLLPNAFKTLFEQKMNMTEYGDKGFRDSSGNLLYRPTQTQAALYMIGFRPRELSQKRQFQRLKTLSEDRAKTRQDSELDDLAVEATRGNVQKMQQYAYGKAYEDPMVDPREIMRSIQNRAVDMQMEKDLLASGSTVNAENLRQLAGTFGPGVVERRSETERMRRKDAIALQLGDPKLMGSMEEYKKAILVDALVKNQGMTRGQALRLVEFMQHGPSGF